MTISREELGFDYNHLIKPCTAWEEYMGEDEWDVNGSVCPSNQQGELYLTPDIFDKYPDNSTFIYHFRNQDATQCTVTLAAKSWSNNTWLSESGGMVGFTSTPTLISDKITVNAGTKITIYASGKDGYDNEGEYWYYSINGFYTSDHVPYKISDANKTIDSYTFTVNNNMTIYVDFQYSSRR